jgi:hypothetical protein
LKVAMRTVNLLLDKIIVILFTLRKADDLGRKADAIEYQTAPCDPSDDESCATDAHKSNANRCEYREYNNA